MNQLNSIQLEKTNSNTKYIQYNRYNSFNSKNSFKNNHKDSKQKVFLQSTDILASQF